MKEKCECGGDIHILCFRNKKNKKIYVEKGVCSLCLKEIVLPPEAYYLFIKKNCKKKG